MGSTITPELVLPVRDIDDLGKDYAFELTPAWLDAALLDTPIRRVPSKPAPTVTVHAQRNGTEYLVHGNVDAELQVECCRCLGEVPLSVHVPLTALLVPRPEGEAASEVEPEDDELDRSYYEGHELVLDGLVRELIVVECPMQPLCSPDCRGIPLPESVRAKPEDFGEAGGIDPRLAPLNELRAKLSEKTKE
jgi:uncharacterized protein